ncbi:CubicO group peptidase (beta-lactamase class C family) [Herbihabitans rhizosphaerae]|uniref:CubicO group peptidase (Beta-lactamase class C family) n=1 Tax=Herbihabitans rhizosphaerae TaxID=1872711 RepID=A0A4Q7KUN4_9PSEU|nr:serine hydrolase domain-containing protein [Herbihabitans rhizosphaerae]RZS39202.1 CubicO group peptidase (beta-lactamase class C family) [Herbihabitans rhizosphaerae]
MPDIDGVTAPAFDAVRDAFAANFTDGKEIGAALCVYLRGEKVVDLWGGLADPEHDRPWRHDTLQAVYSTTKGATSACALVLAERGDLDLDAPVAEYWPEFAAAGKQDIPVRWLLSHQAGLPVLDQPLSLAGALTWTPMAEALAAQRPSWTPGSEHGYHALTFGWLVGEVVRRVSGKSLGSFFRDEIAEPLGLDFWIGLPESEHHRVAPLIEPTPDPDALAGMDLDALPEPMRDFITAYTDPTSLTLRSYACVDPRPDNNDPTVLAAEVPATNGVCTARALATFYAALIGEIDGHRVFGPSALKEATTEQAAGIDRITRTPVRWTTGYALWTDQSPWLPPTMFGFSGLGGSIGFADPDTGLAVGYVMNHIVQGMEPDPRAANLVTAVRECLRSS